MTDITTEQIVEAGARAVSSLITGFVRRHEPLSAGVTARAAYDAMLPLIRKQLADEVRRQCFTSDAVKFAISQGRSVRGIQEFDAALEFAASLIEEVER